MKTYIKLAWRNLWRNKRRTIITVLSVLFAFFLALVMRSMQLGSYDLMIESAVKTSTGYIQIHALGYWDDKTIDNTFISTDTLEGKLLSTRHITAFIPRLESFALISSGDMTKGIAVIGTDPKKEDDISALGDRVIRGSYFGKDDNSVLIGEALADYLKVGVNDTIVLLSQGYHGESAQGAYPIKGIIRFTAPEMNSSMLYMPLTTAQKLYSAPERLTSLSILLDNKKYIKTVADELKTIDVENLEVMTWRELLPEMVQAIQSDSVSGQFMLGILYIVVGFGIFGTILMMTIERRREFGIMVAVGMRRIKLALIVFIETVILALVGIVAGAALSYPIILYYHLHPYQLTGETAKAMAEFNVEPVMPFALDPGFFINQSLVVIILSILAAIYPLTVIGKFKIIPALRGK
jgi:ABC-type lipoprotein release transport system permease subunit